MTMLEKLKRPTIFAHRGSSAYAPENTLAAFELALQHGADAIELDAKLTVDGHVVIIHDQTLQRTTGVPGKVIETSLAEIQKLDAGSHFNIAFKGEHIPTLAELFEKIGDRTLYNIELTNYASLTDSLPEKVAALVARYSLADRILFSSFNPLALIRVRRKLPDNCTGLLARPDKRGRWARSWLGYLLRYQALHIARADATPEIIAATHKRAKRLHVFTVNDAGEMAALFKMGVDGIMTDDPPLARRVLTSILQGSAAP
jgi:glycerophosphoryl diester phosphodiesterase